MLMCRALMSAYHTYVDGCCCFKTVPFECMGSILMVCVCLFVEIVTLNS